jgi:hypothetical protein
MRSQTLSRSPGSDGREPTEIEESIYVFGSGDDPSALVSSVQSQRRSCAKNDPADGEGPNRPSITTFLACRRSPWRSPIDTRGTWHEGMPTSWKS